MKTFVLYEIWTTHRIVKANSETEALENGEPAGPSSEMSLANWYAVEVAEDKIALRITPPRLRPDPLPPSPSPERK